MYRISPGYFAAAGTPLLSGRDITWHDDENTPRVAAIDKEFARRIFGSVSDALGKYYKMPDGARIQIVGIVEDGEYTSVSKSRIRQCFCRLCNRRRLRHSWWCARIAIPCNWRPR